MDSLKVCVADCQYKTMIGVGGIGSGIFFTLDGNHLLGRNESRSARLLDYRDYCKLHIISFYVQRLLGRDFKTIPIGKVGDDEAGRTLLSEMKRAGLDTRYVQAVSGHHTLLSACFLYPDGSGGNITSSNSACALVDPPLVDMIEPELQCFSNHGVVLAVPEVPLSARLELLRLGNEHGFYKVASFTTGEILQQVDERHLDLIDLLAVNMEEAAAFVSLDAQQVEPPNLVYALVHRFQARNKELCISMTAGGRGSWLWDGREIAHMPAIPVPVASSAGAGDAHLAGVIVGLVANLSLPQASELGALVAALSVTSVHTIHDGITRQMLRDLAVESKALISRQVMDLLSD